VWVISSSNQLLVPTAIALGNFDGVHLGHQQVLKQITIPCPDRPCHPTVVSFDPHPRAFFSGQGQPLLTPRQEKAQLLEQLGIDQLVLLPFSPALAQLSPKEFIETILIQQLQAQRISVGADFRFGHQRQGTVQDLQALASRWGIQVDVAQLQQEQGQRISSSQIRQALEQGQVETAQQWLGRPYSLTGTVTTGQKLGQQLGFPTANLQLPADKLLPRWGVYAVQIQGDTFPKPLTGVMNIGDRPTVEGKHLAVEVHIFDWYGDLYGQTLTVYLRHFLRPEQKFASLTALKQQIALDCMRAKTYLQTLVLEFPGETPAGSRS
jgi:riboflavin kinase/FMN adenylyltransferase